MDFHQLIRAAKTGDVETLIILIELGGDVNGKDKVRVGGEGFLPFIPTTPPSPTPPRSVPWSSRTTRRRFTRRQLGAIWTAWRC